jgi:hypothetical protein
MLYRFDVPGRYEVRYAQRSDHLASDGPLVDIRNFSEWTPIDILPAAPELRRKWLADIRSRGPDDPTELLTSCRV